MRLSPALGVVLTTLLLTGPAGVAQADDGTTLPKRCQGWMSGRIVMLCDPARESTESDRPVIPIGRWRGEIRLAGTATRRSNPRDSSNEAVTLDGDEALLPGEVLHASWRDPSPRAVIGLEAATPAGARRAFFRLAKLGTSVTITVGPDGRVKAVGNRATLVVDGQPLLTIPAWTATDPRQAAERVLGGLSHYADRDHGGLYTLCASLTANARRWFDALWDPFGRNECPSAMAYSIQGLENVPTVLGTTGRVTGVRRTGASTAVVGMRLHHRYDPNSDSDPTDRRVWVRALLVRAPDGTWRLANPAPLLPLAVADNPLGGHRSDAQLARGVEELTAQADKVQAAVDRIRAAERPIGSGRVSCPAGPTINDAPNDVTVMGDQRPRRPLPPSSDITELTGATTSSGGLCLQLTTAGTAPRKGELNVWLTPAGAASHDGRRIRVRLYDGRAVSSIDDDDSTGYIPVDVDADGRLLTVVLPPAASAGAARPWTVEAELESPHPLIRYLEVDDATGKLSLPM